MVTENIASVLDSERDRLEGLVHRRLGSRIRELRLVFQETGVILRGHSDSYHAKQVAQHTVMAAAGVPIVANEIEVQ
jgi:hypothetical protein